MKRQSDIRLRNPFRDLLVSEFIEDPVLYRKMFSERILVGETLTVFQPGNVVLLGPLGSGKSMILNLMRYRVLSEWITPYGKLPQPLKQLSPFFGISVNLTRVNLWAFGRRSLAQDDLTPSLVAPRTRVRSLLQHTPSGYFRSTSCVV